MTPYWSDPFLTVYQGDAATVLRELPAESVHCVVTSPPYWGLRDYGTASWEGGDPNCKHEGDGPVVGNNINIRGKDETAMIVGGWDKATDNGNHYRAVPMGGSCRKCGAIRQDAQLGLEPTPEQYVTNLVGVFREVRRVLRSDGTLWLNLGSSYAGSGKGGNPEGSEWSGFMGFGGSGESRDARRR